MGRTIGTHGEVQTQKMVPLTFIGYALDKRERRKATNKAISHSMRVYRRGEYRDTTVS